MIEVRGDDGWLLGTVDARPSSVPSRATFIHMRPPVPLFDPEKAAGTVTFSYIRAEIDWLNFGSVRLPYIKVRDMNEAAQLPGFRGLRHR